MKTYFEVRSRQTPEGELTLLGTSRHDTREEAEQAAREKSRSGFFSQVWMVRECTPLSKGGPPYLVHDYQYEYAAAKVAA